MLLSEWALILVKQIQPNSQAPVNWAVPQPGLAQAPSKIFIDAVAILVGEAVLMGVLRIYVLYANSILMRHLVPELIQCHFGNLNFAKDQEKGHLLLQPADLQYFRSFKGLQLMPVVVISKFQSIQISIPTILQGAHIVPKHIFQDTVDSFSLTGSLKDEALSSEKALFNMQKLPEAFVEFACEAVILSLTISLG